MKITELEKSFGRFRVKIESLSLTPGRMYGIIGPNGCGKTTAMKLMAGLLAPDTGRIDYEGLSMRDMTMAPRKPYFLHDSVQRNLEYPLKLRKIQPDPSLIDQYLAFAGLREQRRQYAPSLSSGEQQKLSLIRAMIFSPKLIFLDEAFSNLDMESTNFFEQLILDRQKKEPVTWVMISHQLSHVKRLCDEVLFMQNGEIEERGTAREILLRPQSPRLVRYLQYEGLD